jgi:ribosomal protein S18 acetylase RimI-like enzyme
MKILHADISIHEMQIGDYDVIYELWRHTSGMGLSNADSKDSIERFFNRNQGLSYVCRDKDKIVGTILCGHDGRRGYIYHVTVANEYRGRGLGRRLVEASLNRLKAEGIDKCHLFVFADNELGNAFWTSAGWEKREDIFAYSKAL